MVTDFFKTKEGNIILSILLGLGLASLFRQVCRGPHCVVFKGPQTQDTVDKVYKVRDACYRYEPTVVDCEDGA